MPRNAIDAAWDLRDLLAAETGAPVTATAYGATVTYRWEHGRASFSHDVQMADLERDPAPLPTMAHRMIQGLGGDLVRRRHGRDNA